MAESNPPQKKTPIDYISDSESSDEELNQHFHTSQEERYYDTIKGSAHTLKQHYHTLLPSVTLQLNEDLTENRRQNHSPKKNPRTRQHRPKKKIS